MAARPGALLPVPSQGAPSAELQAVQAAQGASSGSTAYLNLEPGDCHGEDVAVRSLIDAGVSRVVIGLRHPLPHARGQAIKALRTAGVSVGRWLVTQAPHPTLNPHTARGTPAEGSLASLHDA